MRKLILTPVTGLEIINALNAITKDHYFTIEKWYSNGNLPLPDESVNKIKWEEEKDTLKNITVKAGYTSEKGYNSDFGSIVISLSPLAMEAHYGTGSIFYLSENEIIAQFLNGIDKFVYRRYSIEQNDPEAKHVEYCNRSEGDNYGMHIGSKWEDENFFGLGTEENDDDADNSNTPTVRAFINKALEEAENDNWHEVWRLCKSDLRYWLDHPFAKGDIKLVDEDFEVLDEILLLLGDEYGENADRIDKKCFIHPSTVKKELMWVIDKAKELLKEEVEQE